MYDINVQFSKANIMTSNVKQKKKPPNPSACIKFHIYIYTYIHIHIYTYIRIYTVCAGPSGLAV
jgi:hypothetical protein